MKITKRKAEEKRITIVISEVSPEVEKNFELWTSAQKGILKRTLNNIMGDIEVSIKKLNNDIEVIIDYPEPIKLRRAAFKSDFLSLSVIKKLVPKPELVVKEKVAAKKDNPIEVTYESQRNIFLKNNYTKALAGNLGCSMKLANSILDLYTPYKESSLLGFLLKEKRSKEIINSIFGNYGDILYSYWEADDEAKRKEAIEKMLSSDKKSLIYNYGINSNVFKFLKIKDYTSLEDIIKNTSSDDFHRSSLDNFLCAVSVVAATAKNNNTKLSVSKEVAQEFCKIFINLICNYFSYEDSTYTIFNVFSIIKSITEEKTFFSMIKTFLELFLEKAKLQNENWNWLIHSVLLRLIIIFDDNFMNIYKNVLKSNNNFTFAKILLSLLKFHNGDFKMEYINEVMENSGKFSVPLKSYVTFFVAIHGKSILANSKDEKLKKLAKIITQLDENDSFEDIVSTLSSLKYSKYEIYYTLVKVNKAFITSLVKSRKFVDLETGKYVSGDEFTNSKSFVVSLMPIENLKGKIGNKISKKCPKDIISYFLYAIKAAPKLLKYKTSSISAIGLLDDENLLLISRTPFTTRLYSAYDNFIENLTIKPDLTMLVSKNTYYNLASNNSILQHSLKKESYPQEFIFFKEEFPSFKSNKFKSLNNILLYPGDIKFLSQLDTICLGFENVEDLLENVSKEFFSFAMDDTQNSYIIIKRFLFKKETMTHGSNSFFEDSINYLSSNNYYCYFNSITKFCKIGLLHYLIKSDKDSVFTLIKKLIESKAVPLQLYDKCEKLLNTMIKKDYTSGGFEIFLQGLMCFDNMFITTLQEPAKKLLLKTRDAFIKLFKLVPKELKENPDLINVIFKKSQALM